MGFRHYDPALGHFIQPDTIVPGTNEPSAYNRFGYVSFNPINHSDSSGHCADDDDECWAYLMGEDQFDGQGFCEAIDCGDEGWKKWITLNSDSIWTLSELKRVKDALLTTKNALELNGYDWLEVLGDLQFERFNMERISPGQDRSKSIYDEDGNLMGLQLSHRAGNIGLSNQAFERSDIVAALIHEMGHGINYSHDGVPLSSFVSDENYATNYWTTRGTDFDTPGEQWADAFQGYILNASAGDGALLRGENGISPNWDNIHSAVHSALSVSVNR